MDMNFSVATLFQVFCLNFELYKIWIPIIPAVPYLYIGTYIIYTYVPYLYLYLSYFCTINILGWALF